MFSELFAPVSIGVRTIAKTVRILERNHIEKAIISRERSFKDWKTEGPKEKFAKLTYRQKQVLTDISKGVPSRFIADHLNISIRTVERHRQNGMRICGVKSTQELIEFLRKVKT